MILSAYALFHLVLQELPWLKLFEFVLVLVLENA